MLEGYGKYIQINDPDRESNRCLLMQIVKIGLPSALETALYNAAMTLIISLLNRMDSAGLHVTARAYTAQITNFSYCVGAALAQANAIIIGWNLGAKRFDECNKSTKQALHVQRELLPMYGAERHGNDHLGGLRGGNAAGWK